jgi:UDP-glucose 4-epimerase
LTDGPTVLELIEAAKKLTGKNFPVNIAGRRAGDPPSLIADEAIVRDAWNFEQRRGR